MTVASTSPPTTPDSKAAAATRQRSSPSATPSSSSAYHILIGHQPYHDVGADYYLRRDEQAHARRLVRQLENLGYDVTLNAKTPPPKRPFSLQNVTR
jgi:hypothetical protein